MRLTTADKALMRTQPHSSTMWLSIYQPRIVFSAQVDDASISRGAMTIPYDNITSGTYANVFDDAMMYIGTTPGDDNKGRIRVRDATASYVKVAENSHIEWANDLFITVMNFVDIEAIYPRIINDPNNDENVIFYKDYDIAYTNQNEVMGTFVCAGPHRAAFVNDQLYWTATGTYNVIGDGLTYYWQFGGGTPTTSNDETPGWVTYDTPGHYRTRLIVSGTTAGSHDTTYRFVSIYDKPGEGTETPITKWEMSDLNGSRDSGGYTSRVKIRDTNVAGLQDNALVVIFSEDYYGTTKRSLGGNAENSSSIFFVGYILKGSITYNYQDGYVEFTIGSVSEVMKVTEGFSVSCEDNDNPDTWFEIKDMSVQRAIYHYLRWHSTVLRVTDFQYLDDDRRHQYFDTDRNSLYDAIDSFLTTGLVGKMVADRQGKLWGEIDVKATHLARSAFPVTFTNFGNRDWMNSPTLDERTYPDMSWLEMGGIVYRGGGLSSGSSSALLAQAPGEAPKYHGKLSRHEGLIVTSQLQLNRLVGNVFAYENSRYPSLAVDLRGNYSCFDIAPNESIWLDIAEGDTPRGIVLTNEPFHVTSMNWRYDTQKQWRGASAYFAQVTNGLTGTAIPVPEIPPDDGHNQPPPVIPPVPWGGGIGSAPFDYYIFTYLDGGPTDGYIESRGGFTATVNGTMGNISASIDIVVPSDGLYLMGVQATKLWNSTSPQSYIGVDITPDGDYISPYPIEASAIASNPSAGSPFNNTATASPALKWLNSGDNVNFSYYMAASPPLVTLRRFYAWITKISS